MKSSSQINDAIKKLEREQERIPAEEKDAERNVERAQTALDNEKIKLEQIRTKKAKFHGEMNALLVEQQKITAEEEKKKTGK